MSLRQCAVALAFAHVYGPLKRGPNQENRSNVDGPLGPGLYIARKIDEAHGGEIEARSDETETVLECGVRSANAAPHVAPPTSAELRQPTKRPAGRDNRSRPAGAIERTTPDSAHAAGGRHFEHISNREGAR